MCVCVCFPFWCSLWVWTQGESGPRDGTSTCSSYGLGFHKPEHGPGSEELWVDAPRRFRTVDRVFDANKLQRYLESPSDAVSDMEGYLSEDVYDPGVVRSLLECIFSSRTCCWLQHNGVWSENESIC